MNEELKNILSEVRKQMSSTVISYEKRDPDSHKWGNPKYNGNCSGKVPLGFIDKFGAKSVAELYAGSGTLSDVCKDYGIPYCGIDLNPNPVRSDIISMDILDMEQELPEFFHEADMCFSHPPYPGINHVKYAGSAWKDTIGNLAFRDIQNMPFEKGMEMINLSTMRAYAALHPGAFMVLLVGEIRSHGKYFSMYQHLALPGEVFQSYVKLQHNTWSGRQSYSGNANYRAMTGHEMIAVIKKPSGYEICYVLPHTVVMDIRDSIDATWMDVIMMVAHNLHNEFTYQEVADQIRGHKKAANNKHLEEKIRQILQRAEKAGLLFHNGRNSWSINRMKQAC